MSAWLQGLKFAVFMWYSNPGTLVYAARNAPRIFAAAAGEQHDLGAVQFCRRLGWSPLRAFTTSWGVKSVCMRKAVAINVCIRVSLVLF